MSTSWPRTRRLWPPLVMDDWGAGGAVRYGVEDRVNDYTRRVRGEDDLELVTATYRWWVGDDHRSGWRPPPEPVVRGWQAIYREQWTDQAHTLFAYVEAIAADYPHLCRPAAGIAAGQLVREWTLTPEGVTDRHVAKAEALADYEAGRQAGIADHLRQLPIHRCLVASEAALVTRPAQHTPYGAVQEGHNPK